MANHSVESDARAVPSRVSDRSSRGRKLAVTLHRTIGLGLGAIFVSIGLSGSLLAFRDPIDEWLNADIMRVEVPEPATYRPLDAMLAAAIAVAPPNGVPERLRLPRHAGLAAAVTFMVTTDDLETDFREIFVDPYRAEVTGERLLIHADEAFSQPLIHILTDFHWTLLLGPNRAYLVGFAAIFLFVSVLAGAWLAWPRHGGWRRALTIQWAATPERVTYDLHRTIGLGLFAVLTVVLFTGSAMVFKPQTRAILALLSPLPPESRDVASVPVPGRPSLGLDAVVAIADKIFPDGRLHRILLPAGPTSAYVVGKQADDEPNRTGTSRNVSIDRYSGEVLHIADRGDFTAGETFLEWLYPLHCGEAFGNSGRAFVLATGLVPLALFVTGFLRWRQKRRARRARRPGHA